MSKIKDIPRIDRPRERFLKKGPEALSKSDLLAILLWSGIKGKNVQQLSQQIIKKFGTKFLDVTVDDLQKVAGIGPAKALQMVSAISLVKRFYEENKGNDGIQGTLFDYLEIEKPAYEASIEEQGFQPMLPQSKKRQPRIRKEMEEMINKVHCGDCIELMQHIPDKSIDMVLCDLPYGTTQNQWDSVIPLDRLWQQYERVIKDNGAIILTSQGVFTAKLILSNEKLFKYKIVWEKSKSTNFLNAKKQPLRKHEDICVFYKSQPLYYPQMRKGEAYNKGMRKDQLTGSYGDFKPVEVKSDGERYPIDVVYFKTAESEWPVYHPTQKPVALGQYLIRTFTNPGDIILDNTCGSGSFLVSAVLEDRNFIGIEKNSDVHLFKNEAIDYIKVCEERIACAQKNFKPIS